MTTIYDELGMTPAELHRRNQLEILDAVRKLGPAPECLRCGAHDVPLQAVGSYSFCEPCAVIESAPSEADTFVCDPALDWAGNPIT